MHLIAMICGLNDLFDNDMMKMLHMILMLKMMMFSPITNTMSE